MYTVYMYIEYLYPSLYVMPPIHGPFVSCLGVLPWVRDPEDHRGQQAAGALEGGELQQQHERLEDVHGPHARHVDRPHAHLLGGL